MHSCKNFVLHACELKADIMINILEKNTKYDIYIRIKRPITCKYLSEIFMTLEYIEFDYSLIYMISYAKNRETKQTSTIYHLALNHFCQKVPKENPLELRRYISQTKNIWISRYGF